MSAATKISNEEFEETLSPQALQNLHTGKEKKDAGDAAFKSGDAQAGPSRLHRCCTGELSIF